MLHHHWNYNCWKFGTLTLVNANGISMDNFIQVTEVIGYFSFIES